MDKDVHGDHVTHPVVIDLVGYDHDPCHAMQRGVVDRTTAESSLDSASNGALRLDHDPLAVVGGEHVSLGVGAVLAAAGKSRRAKVVLPIVIRGHEIRRHGTHWKRIQQCEPGHIEAFVPEMEVQRGAELRSTGVGHKRKVESNLSAFRHSSVRHALLDDACT